MKIGRRWRLGWLAGIIGIPPLIFVGSWAWAWLGIYGQIWFPTTDTVASFVNQLPQVLTGVLGFTVSVVAIVVQLAADRLTPKVTDLFLRERINLAVYVYLIVATLISVWTLFIYSVIEKPFLLIFFNLILGTLAFIILIPYFIFVFRFLQPASIIGKIDQQIRKAVISFDPVHRHGKVTGLADVHCQCLYGIEELKAIAANAIQHRESQIVLSSLDSLKALTMFYMSHKDHLPDQWFHISQPIRRDPDFVSIDRYKLSEIEVQKIWLELKILREYQAIFSDSLIEYREACYIIGINTREIIEQGFSQHSETIVSLGVKFFNTFLRAIINKNDIRTGYNILKQYRQVAEAALNHQAHLTVLEICQHLRYYSLLCHKSGLFFLCETIAFDLSQLAELCCDRQAPVLSEKLVDILLRIDQDPESEQQENSLRGIRKSQSKLAAFYLRQGFQSLAVKIYEDMQDEPKSRLRIIEEELINTQADFWEFTDRGDNFYYVEPSLQPYVIQFFQWFGSTPHEPSPQPISSTPEP